MSLGRIEAIRERLLPFLSMWDSATRESAVSLDRVSFFLRKTCHHKSCLPCQRQRDVRLDESTARSKHVHFDRMRRAEGAVTSVVRGHCMYLGRLLHPQSNVVESHLTPSVPLRIEFRYPAGIQSRSRSEVVLQTLTGFTNQIRAYYSSGHARFQPNFQPPCLGTI
jgi:hypothetical protein